MQAKALAEGAAVLCPGHVSPRGENVTLCACVSRMMWRLNLIPTNPLGGVSSESWSILQQNMIPVAAKDGPLWTWHNHLFNGGSSSSSSSSLSSGTSPKGHSRRFTSGGDVTESRLGNETDSRLVTLTEDRFPLAPVTDVR
jgi:hypothetical protein